MTRAAAALPDLVRGARSAPRIITATVLAAMLIMANVSVLNVALPELSRELGASQTDLHWIVDIYAVFLAALLLPAGALGDRYGRRPMLLLGLSILLVSNAAVLLMDSAGPVIVARAVSGTGAALAFPATLSTITATLPGAKRSRGVAIWTVGVFIGGIVGILASGALVEQWWWGSPFLGVAVVLAVVIVLVWRDVPDSSDREHANLDPVGGALSFVAVGALVLGVVEGPAEGWTGFATLRALGVGALAFAAFVLWERRTDRPLLDVRLFADHGLRAASISIFTQFCAAFGFFFVAVFYLAFVLGYGPFDTGLALMPAALGVLPAALVSIPLTKHAGRRAVGLVGLAVLVVAFVLGLRVGVGSGYWTFGVSLVVFGAGIGLLSPPATEAIVESLPPNKQGVASALNDVLRECGAAFGIAIVGAAFNAGYRSAIDEIVGLPAESVDAVRETPAAAVSLAPGLGEQGPDLVAGVSRAVVAGWDRAMWVTVCIVLVGYAGYYLWAPARRQARLIEVDLTPPPGFDVRGTPAMLAMVEERLAGLDARYRELAATVRLLDVRSKLPDDIHTWDSGERAAVIDRGAAAMRSSVDEVAALHDHVRIDAREVEQLLVGAIAELGPSGLGDPRSATLRAHLGRLRQRSHETHTTLERIDQRFVDLAFQHPPLVAVSRQLALLAGEAWLMVQHFDGWEATRTAPAQPSAT